jgi:hypothetical protein
MATGQLYGKLGANILGGEVAGDAFQMDYLSDTIKLTLHTSTYSPNIDTNEILADATNQLATANGYTSGGYTLASKTVSYNATGNVTTYDFGDVTVTASGGTLTFQYAVISDSTIASSPLIGYIDLGAQSITTGNSLVIATDATGAFTATVT